MSPTITDDSAHTITGTTTPEAPGNKRKADAITKEETNEGNDETAVVEGNDETAVVEDKNTTTATTTDNGGGDAVQAVEEEVAAAAVATEADNTDAPMPDAEGAAAEGGDDDNTTTKGDDDDGGASATDGGAEGSASKRRFFPRVKHLLTPEWEPFLIGVLDALEEAGAPAAAVASHKASNPWYKAFNLIYYGVARDCSVPHGKNRYHKFKDKIIELWQGIEAYTGAEDLPARERGLAQFEEYRKACETHAMTPKKEGTPGTMTPGRSLTTKIPGSAAMATPRIALDGRGAFSARRSILANSTAGSRIPWKHLDEAAALASLPEPLKSLVHIRQVVNELGTNNSAAVKEQYDKALQEYLKEEIPEAATTMATTTTTTEEEGTATAAAVTAAVTTPNTDALYQTSMALAFLCRYSLSATETKEITEVYERVVSSYLDAMNDTSVPV